MALEHPPLRERAVDESGFFTRAIWTWLVRARSQIDITATDSLGQMTEAHPNDIVVVDDTGVGIKDSGKTLPAGAVVGDTDTQTLTNKTLDAPVLNSPSLPNAAGRVTLAAAASTVVACTAIGVNSVVVCFPANTHATEMIASSKNPYVSVADHVAGVSFTIRTGNANAANGDEIFNYVVLN